MTEAFSPATSPDRVDAAICGGGLSGQMTALALATSLGDEVRIALIAPTARFGADADDPRAYAISAATRHLLQAIGVWEVVEADAQPITEIRITDSSTTCAVRPTLLSYDNQVEDDATGENEPASHVIAESVLAEAVRTAVLGCRNVHRIIGEVQDVDLATGAIRLGDGGGTLTASLVIAADGARSRLRALAGIKVVTTPHRQRAIVTIVGHEIDHGGVAVQHFLPGGPFAILPMTGKRCCITWSEQAREAERIVALSDDAFMDEVELRFGGQLGQLTLAGGRRTFPLTTRIARELTAARLALVGDAARAVHPIAGQGLNLAARDIAALVECIADAMRVGLDAGDTGAVLTRYARWRRFDSVASASAFAGLNHLFSNDFTLLRSLREAGLGIVDRLPAVKRRLVKEAAGLTGKPPKLLRGELV